MKTKRLTVEESRKLIWLTWFEFVIAGIIVYFFTNPTSVALLLVGPIVLHALINFWVKSEGVPVTLHSPLPAVFMPTAFLTGFAALVIGATDDQILNSWTLALAVMCVLCIMVIYPESGYADY